MAKYCMDCGEKILEGTGGYNRCSYHYQEFQDRRRAELKEESRRKRKEEDNTSSSPAPTGGRPMIRDFDPEPTSGSW